MKKIISILELFALFAVVGGFVFVSFSGCNSAQAREIEPDWTWKIAPTDNTNNAAMDRLMAQEVEEAFDAVTDANEQVMDAIAEKEEAEYQAWLASQAPAYGGGTYYAAYSDAYNTDGPSRTMPGWYDGYLETYYSSNTLYHYRTDEWTVDEEGFYRDDQGRYIVGVDINEGIELGTEIETGKGTAVVSDYGSGAHVHDFYTNW